MAKRLNIFTIALFVWAMVFAPAIHLASGHADDSCAACSHESHAEHGGQCPGHVPPVKHDAAHCAICQLAATPALATTPVIFLVPEPTPVVLPEYSFHAPTVPAACRLPFSCGPPA